jgi:hypothetical protein
MSPFILLYALTRPGAIVGIIIVIVLYAASPVGRRGRLKGKMRLVASNVFRERDGEEPRQFDYWKVLCMGLGIGILVCMVVAMVVIDRSDEVSELAGWLSLLVMFFSLMLVLASGGYLAYRISSGRDLIRYAAELECMDTAIDVNYDALSRKMGFSKKDVDAVSAPRKKWSKAKENLVIFIGAIVFAAILLLLMSIDKY